MLGASDFTPLDLLGTLGLNAASTYAACNDGSLRVGLKVGKGGADGKGVVEAYTDARFVAGVLGALAGQFGPPMTRRVGNDVAVGLLGSFVSTETCRAAAKAKQDHWEMVSNTPQQITESAPAQKVKQGDKNYARGSMNSAYGW